MLDYGFYNMDCMEGMKEFPDGYFDLAIVDPPYGGAGSDFAGNERFGGWFERYRIQADRTGGTWAKKFGNKIAEWDTAPSQAYFDELFRVSKNQIIWGGNYFTLPPTRCFVVWKKLTISEGFSMAMAEYAWTSFKGNAKVVEMAPQDPTKKRFHPTQKPVRLYEWLLTRFSEQGQTILDTHVGSGSSLVACERLNHKYVGFEIEPVYFEKAKERIKRDTAQMTIFNLEGVEYGRMDQKHTDNSCHLY